MTALREPGASIRSTQRAWERCGPGSTNSGIQPSPHSPKKLNTLPKRRRNEHANPTGASAEERLRQRAAGPRLRRVHKWHGTMVAEDTQDRPGRPRPADHRAQGRRPLVRARCGRFGVRDRQGSGLGTARSPRPDLAANARVHLRSRPHYGSRGLIYARRHRHPGRPRAPRPRAPGRQGRCHARDRQRPRWLARAAATLRRRSPKLGRRRSMSGITVYGIPGSPFLRSVEIALKEKDVLYHLHALAPGEHKQPEHLARHAFGRVPAFEHDGFALYETQAIVRYLDEVYPNPSLTPGNPQQRERMNQVIGIIEWYFFPKAAAPIAFNRIIGQSCSACRPTKPRLPRPC